MRIEINCAACGNNRFSFRGDLNDDSVIACQDCGHVIGTVAELKERVAEEVLSRAPRPKRG
ncbi:MAG TPA: hypothetical protein VNT77_03450 [Allosphingosinicella sp.]|nr:hypothetical protein [Allosphingosinicella sp.]